MEKGTYKESAKRFTAVLKELNITKYRFAKVIGYKSPSTASKLADGRTSITHKSATRFIEVFPQLNFNYLIGTEDKILASKPIQTLQRNIQKGKTENENEILNNKLDLLFDKLDKIEKLLKKS